MLNTAATEEAVNALAQDLNARMHQVATNISTLQNQTIANDNIMALTQSNNIYLNKNNHLTNVEIETSKNSKIENINNNESNNDNLFNLMQVIYFFH